MLISTDGGVEKGGVLNVTDHGLVAITGMVGVSNYGPYVTESDYGFVNMDTGGTLAIMGEIDDSLTQFLQRSMATK